jgi:hypothetical protein
MPKLDSTPTPSHDEELREARQNIKQLTVELHRLRARISRLEADGEDETADRLTAEIRDREAEIARDQHKVQRFASAKLSPAIDSRPATFETEVPNAKDEPDADGAPLAIKLPPDSGARRTKRPARQGATFWNVREQPGWVASILVHVALLVGLALLNFVRLQNPPPVLASGGSELADELLDEWAEISLELDEVDHAMAVDATWETIAPNVTELAIDVPLTRDALAADETLDLGVRNLVALDAGALLAEVGGGNGKVGRAGSGGTTPNGDGEASFFGKRSRGNRFVFLIDNSGTMKDGRLETAFLEILNSVGQMKPNQLFHVVFYSDQAYPMFHPNGIDALVPATRENKQKLEAWLTTVEMCTGGELNDAVDLATRLEPAAVYILSDGDIVESRIRRLMEKAPERPFSIHTLGMTVRNQADAANLAAIANAHRGTYTPVGIRPAAVQMSRARPIRYNREPGEIWGNKIRKW